MLWKFNARSHWPILALVIALVIAQRCPADPPAPRPSPADLATPRDSLLAYDRWCVDLQDFAHAGAFYSATSPREKDVVRESLKFDQVSAAIERLSRAAFGAPACTAILHEYGDVDLPDIKSAPIDVNGNTAVVHFPTVQYDLTMIKSQDQWLVDSASLMQSYGGHDNAIHTLEAQIANLQPIADGLAAGKFKTAQEVIQAIDKTTGQK